MQVVKHNNRIQRAHCELNKEVATALMRFVLAGGNLYPQEGFIEVELEDGKTETVKRGTLNAWIYRNNVVPETGQTLRSLLDDARGKYRSMQREKRQEMMLLEAEAEMHRALRLRTSQPVIGMFGVVKDENGDIVRKENPNLLKIKMDIAKFIAERLDPNRYAQQTNVKGSHLIFSLADLRSASQGDPVKLEV